MNSMLPAQPRTPGSKESRTHLRRSAPKLPRFAGATTSAWWKRNCEKQSLRTPFPPIILDSQRLYYRGLWIICFSYRASLKTEKLQLEREWVYYPHHLGSFHSGNRCHGETTVEQNNILRPFQRSSNYYLLTTRDAKEDAHQLFWPGGPTTKSPLSVTIIVTWLSSSNLLPIPNTDLFKVPPKIAIPS